MLVQERRNSNALEKELHLIALTHRFQLNNVLPDVEIIPMSKSKESITIVCGIISCKHIFYKYLIKVSLFRPWCDVYQSEFYLSHVHSV